MPMRAFVLFFLLATPPAAAAADVPYVVGPPGAYTVQTSGTTKIERGDGWVKISWSNDPAPNPGPTPGPDPPPNPDPPPVPAVTGRLQVSYVFDPAAETQAQATTRADLATSPVWSAIDADLRAYAVDQKALDDLNLRSSLAELPCLVVQERKPDGKAPVIKVAPAVKTAEEAIKVVKDLRGAK